MGAGADRVRLDKWLWAARFFRTRSLASQAIDLGHVRVDGERTKPAREARVGEMLDVQVGDQRVQVVVRALSAQRGPASVARELYLETADSVARRERRAEQRAAEPAKSIKGRPTKRDRRELGKILRG
ncbi:MAG TPA: RNA-binding S4 domain-containing protein [Burkholderiaceae bacterium]|jgi:ribosome-associated heat shock protein Hsp15|nr:RNA-binding S4 domain-containing protein [Burkholderiaceae bacterium]